MYVLYYATTKVHVMNSIQGLFQDFASEWANAKFQNSRGGQIQSQGGATPY